MKELTYEFKEKYIVLTIYELLYSVIESVWFVFPLFKINNVMTAPYLMPLVLSGINFSLTNFDINSIQSLFFKIMKNSLFLIYLIPIISIYKIVSFFLKGRMPAFFKASRFFPLILNIISSSLIIFTFFNYTLLFASNISFFFKLDIINYAFLGTTLVFNFLFVFILMRVINRLSKDYKDYLSLLQNIKKIGGKKKNETVVSIRLKLIFSFMFIFITILIILSYVLMNDYKKTILDSIENNGKLLANQSASFFKENFNDDININFYLIQQYEKNKKTTLPFQSLSFYKKLGKEDKYIINNSTDKTMINVPVPDTDIINLNTKEKIHNTQNKTYFFVSQIQIQSKTIGYSVVTYKEDVIYESYFKTQVRMFIIIFIFLYVSIMLVYLLGSRISLPMIFLRMNVKKLSASLEKILSGQEKLSAGTLVFDDVQIKSKDEIRSLSLEINDLVGVIKGIIPYVSASTLKHADKEGIKSMKKELSFLFTDIRGFTTMCEGLAPDKVVDILNRYLDLQTEIIVNCGGDIDKFVGDEIMASFDGSSRELNACKAAMSLIESMEKEKVVRDKEGLKTINIGIGINSGPVVFGSVGAKDRMDFTSIGDTVNLAARLEGANKEYHTKVLISDFVYKKIYKNFLCREIDIITVKGKNKPVKIYEILQEKGKVTKKQVDLAKNFQEALSLYRKKEWKKALDVFKTNIEKFNDGPSKVFVERIKHFIKNEPPKIWDGVFTMTVK